jgi:putative spermidine/putrescine transport system permease protein
MSFTGDDTLGFPPTSWSLRWYKTFFADETMTHAAVTSFWIAIGSALLALALGITASYALVRGNIRGSQVLYTMILAPIIVPSVVAAVGTYKVFAEWGIIGSIPGVLLAHTPGSLAYVVIILSGTFMGLDKRLEMASASLGASRLRTMFRVILPLVAPGILAAGIFAFIHSFDEIVITSFVAGVTLQTLPQQIWLIIQYQIDPQIAAISTLIMILPILALPFFQRR